MFWLGEGLRVGESTVRGGRGEVRRVEGVVGVSTMDEVEPGGNVVRLGRGCDVEAIRREAMPCRTMWRRGIPSIGEVRAIDGCSRRKGQMRSRPFHAASHPSNHVDHRRVRLEGHLSCNAGRS